jgi:putative transposase
MNKELPQRKSPRLKGFDYSNSAYYFITICTINKKELFGNITNTRIELNERGIIIDNCWNKLPDHFTNIELDYYVIMPNHFHAIIIMNGPVGLRSPQPGINTNIFSLSQIIAYFKYQSTKEINKIFTGGVNKIWQRSFYDRIIRNEHELYNTRRYIEQNPLKWGIENDLPENLDV